MTTDSQTASDPLALYDELLLEGLAPDKAAFCAAHPDHPSLAHRIEALERLHLDLGRLAAPAGAAAEETCPAAPPGFRLIRNLGRGGMGLVVLAEQLSPRRLCALKFIQHATPEAHARFAREADSAARLSHPGVAAVYAFGAEGGHAYLATEYVHGFSLRALLQVADLVAQRTPGDWVVEALSHLDQGMAGSSRPSAPGPVPAMAGLAIQLADALAHAHDRGVVHRDVKPSNVMVTFDGTAKLIDFGIAISEDGQDDRVTRTGSFVGSFDYAAPEQLRGDASEIGPWSDTYSLGATLFEMLALRTPFESARFPDRLVLAGSPPPHGPRHYNPSVPAALDALVLRALDPTPARRFQDGRELGEALRRCPTGGASFPVMPQVVGRLALALRSRGLALLTLMVAGLFAALYARERDAATATARAAREAERRAADAVLTWQIEAHRADLEGCLPPPQSARAPPNPMALPPRLAATVVAAYGQVSRVEPVSSFGVSSTTQACLVRRLQRLELPGVGLRGPVTLTVNLRMKGRTLAKP